MRRTNPTPEQRESLQAITTLGNRQLGDAVNLETDILAKYIERQITDYPR